MIKLKKNQIYMGQKINTVVTENNKMVTQMQL